MAERVVLHVGLMKSGTTFIQGRLLTNREQLAHQGILFPGRNWAEHSRGVKDLLGNPNPRARPGTWEGLREEIDGFAGTAIISMEYLGPIAPDRIAKVVGEFPDTDVQVVLTVRDLGRCVPAMWQETVKNRRTWTWSEYLNSIDKGGKAGASFWRQHSAGEITSRWVSAVGADHVTVVIVPPPGAPSELLWDRFREATGIAAATWAEAPRANESLGASSALVMRRLNEELANLDRAGYEKRVKSLARHTLVSHREQEESIGFRVPKWLRKRSAQTRAEIASSGAMIIGDLAELEPVDVPGVDPSKVSAESERDAAVAALAAVLRDGKGAFKSKKSSTRKSKT